MAIPTDFGLKLRDAEKNFALTMDMINNALVSASDQLNDIGNRMCTECGSPDNSCDLNNPIWDVAKKLETLVEDVKKIINN